MTGPGIHEYETIDAATGELVPYQTAPPAVNLFRTEKPEEIIERASETANALMAVVRKQHLTAKIQGKDYPLVEAWTLCGTMLGVFPVCTWTRKLDDGWEARVEARTLAGQVVGAAEAQCTRGERTWAGRDEYALRSMAQTRATSKALRQPLGFVMTLAGLEATPAEEMTGVQPEPVVERSPFEPPATVSVATEPQQKNIHRLIDKLCKEQGLDAVRMAEAMQKEYGTSLVNELTKAQASNLIERLKLKAGETV
jgi:cytochrome b